MRQIVGTERLTMRLARDKDVDVLHAIWIDPAVRRYLWDDVIIPRRQAVDAVLASHATFQKKGFGLWTIALPGDRKPFGFCGYHYFREPPELELLFGLTPTHWGKASPPRLRGRCCTMDSRRWVSSGWEEVQTRPMRPRVGSWSV